MKSTWLQSLRFLELCIFLDVLICHRLTSVVISRDNMSTLSWPFVQCCALVWLHQTNEAEEMSLLTMPARIATEQLVNDLCLAHWPWHPTDGFLEEMNPIVTPLGNFHSNICTVKTVDHHCHSTTRGTTTEKCSSFCCCFFVCFFCSEYVPLKINTYPKKLMMSQFACHFFSLFSQNKQTKNNTTKK